MLPAGRLGKTKSRERHSGLVSLCVPGRRWRSKRASNNQRVQARVCASSCVALTASTALGNLRRARKGAAAGPAGYTSEFCRLVLDDETASALFIRAASALAQARVPPCIAAAFGLGRLVALRKPNGRAGRAYRQARSRAAPTPAPQQLVGAHPEGQMRASRFTRLWSRQRASPTIQNKVEAASTAPQLGKPSPPHLRRARGNGRRPRWQCDAHVRRGQSGPRVRRQRRQPSPGLGTRLGSQTSAVAGPYGRQQLGLACATCEQLPATRPVSGVAVCVGRRGSMGHLALGNRQPPQLHEGMAQP